MAPHNNPKDRLDFRRDFSYPDGWAYLNTAAESLLLEESRAGMMEFLSDKSRGEIGRKRYYEVEEECRAKAGSLLGVPSRDIAFLAGTSDGTNSVVLSLAWQPGDNVVITDLEFPSNVLPCIRLARRGVEVRYVRSRDGLVQLDDVAKEIDRRTKLLLASVVSYRNGFKFDLERLGDLARSRGALLLVDAIQALGATPVDAKHVDFLVSGTYKWLLGVTGLGIFYCSPKAQAELEPAAIGWYSVESESYPARLSSYSLREGARRFQIGNPDFAAIYVLNRSLDYIRRVGVDFIEERLASLTGRLIKGLTDLPVELLTPRDPKDRAGIVSFAVEEPEALVEELVRRRIRVFCVDGVVRVSPYLYNNEEEIDLFLEELGRLLRRRSWLYR